MRTGACRTDSGAQTATLRRATDTHRRPCHIDKVAGLLASWLADRQAGRQGDRLALLIPSDSTM